jgi:hypothetical protein
VGENRNAYTLLVGKLKKRPLGEPTRRREDDID